MPSISVIVCTVRAKTLPHTIQSLLAQEHRDWELIVVDQSQTPEIGAYLESLCERRIQHLPLTTRGKSIAQNAGIAASSADILAATDDDCQPAPDWLTAIAAAFQDDKADMIFGPVVPPPTYDPGKEFCPTDHIPEPVRWTWEALEKDVSSGLGANLSLHRRVVQKIGLFDPSLGPGSPLVPLAEETDYSLRALANGLRVLRAPLPAVTHTFGVRPGSDGKRLEMVGNFGVGVAHEKQILAPYGSIAAPHLNRLYKLLRRQVIINILRGRRQNLGLKRLRAMLGGRAYMRSHFTVGPDSWLVSRTSTPVPPQLPN